MNYAYIRVSSKGQSYDRQLLDFADRGIVLDYLYEEKQSGKNMTDRPKLRKLLQDVKEGDTIYVTELTRLARSVSDLANIAKILVNKGVALKSLKESIDLGSSSGILTYNILSAVAEFERMCIHERQAEGIAAARAKGITWGAERKYTYDQELANRVFLSYKLDKINGTVGSEELGVPLQVFYDHYKKWCMEHGYEIEDRRRKKKGKSEWDL